MVLRAKDVSPSQLNYSPVKRSKSGKYTFITYNDSPLRIQLSKSQCRYINKGNRHFLCVTLNSNDAKFFKKLDGKIENSYIDDDNPLEYSHQLINGTLTLRMTMDTNNKFLAKLYEPGENPKEVDYNSSNLPLVLENRNLSVIVECIGIWFKKGKVGVTWKVNQMQLNPYNLTNKYAFVESDEDDDEEYLYPSDSDL